METEPREQANLIGLVALAGDSTVVAWALTGHYTGSGTSGVAVSLSPEQLLRSGPTGTPATP